MYSDIQYTIPSHAECIPYGFLRNLYQSDKKLKVNSLEISLFKGICQQALRSEIFLFLIRAKISSMMGNL